MKTITRRVAVKTTRRRKKVDQCDPLPGSVQRVSEVMALAIRFDQLIRSGEVKGIRQLAEIGRISQPRVSQILALVSLAPDLQESLLFLPRPENGKDTVFEKQVRPLAMELDWSKQRRMWKELQSGKDG